ncbi:V-type proton ATPase subunit d1 [Salvia divinorum]|uniref:V-type proton ATPase subunit d1 n=1 Tax=Salvia divinorum TaxID=28513 RepID=A0ABD1FTW1_SALDI
MNTAELYFRNNEEYTLQSIPRGFLQVLPEIIMSGLLVFEANLMVFEADRRAVNITINSIGTELTREDRRKLYSNFGLLYPYGHEELAICEDTEQVINYIPSYVLS